DILQVEVRQPAFERPAAVDDQVCPCLIPSAQINVLVNAFNEGFLAGKVPVDSGMGDADPLCEFARLPFETLFGEEADCLFEDKLLPLAGAHVAPRTRWFFGAIPAFGEGGLICHGCPDPHAVSL